MTSNLILSRSQSPISRRAAKQSATKRKQTKSPAARKSSSLPPETVEYLKAWMMSPEHIAHPYPTEQEKCVIMADTGIELKQLTNWFVNNRKRYWKPRVEARLQQQQQQQVKTTTTKFPTTQTTAPYIALDMTKSSSSSARAIVSPSTSAVNMVNPSAFVSFDRSRSPRAVSIGSSSFASESDDASLVSNEDEDIVVEQVDADTQMMKRTETVDVHILRPIDTDPFPTMEDVTILANVPSDRILKTFDNVTLSYRFPLDDKKTAQIRRDSEIVKMKKQYLKKFLAETAAAAAGIVPAEEEASEAASKKRAREEEDEPETNRPKYLRRSPPIWRDACRSADNIYDRELPSLEEASHLFGYSV